MVPSRSRYLFGAIGVLILGAASVPAVVVSKAPFRRNQLTGILQAAGFTEIQIGNFEQKWYPPGFAAGRVRLVGKRGGTLTIENVTLQSTYLGLLGRPKVITRIRANGLRYYSPMANLSQSWRDIAGGESGRKISVSELRLDDAGIMLRPRDPSKKRVDIFIHRLVLGNVAPDEQTRFDVEMRTPALAGEVRARGVFGPLNTRDSARTPLSGTFTFDHADISVHRGISGFLSSAGEFDGTIGELKCKGSADVPDFKVFGSSHSVDVHADYHAIVDVRNGNAVVDPVNARFAHTAVLAAVQVANAPEKNGKLVTVDTRVRNGRVEDLISLFTRAPTPAMKGAITLRSRFTIPPAPPGFLTRLGAQGEFTINGAEFTNPNAQTPIDRLSASAEGESKHEQRENPTLVPGVIRGQVSSRQGTANLVNVTFSVPGVDGRLAGTFGLVDRHLNLQGTLDTPGKLADTTSGLKSVLLKAISPLWPKKEASVKSVPFAITGTASQPVFKLKLGG